MFKQRINKKIKSPHPKDTGAEAKKEESEITIDIKTVKEKEAGKEATGIIITDREMINICQNIENMTENIKKPQKLKKMKIKKVFSI